MIEEFGLERMRQPHVKHLRGPIWEMRMRGRDGISRALYVAANGKRVVIVRVFVKKTQQTPNREIWVAARSGGFHFASREGAWRDTRSGEELFASLARLIELQASVRVRWN